MARHRVRFSAGRIGAVHTDHLQHVLTKTFGRPDKLERASHVEPLADGTWQADMSPVSGPVLGPFKTRAEALSAEHEWLTTNRAF